MKITVSNLRRIIQEALDEVSMIQNTTSPETDDRESLEHMQLKTPDGEDEMSPHLINFDEEDFDQGPVPRRGRNDDSAFPVYADPYANDWNAATGSPR